MTRLTVICAFCLLLGACAASPTYYTPPLNAPMMYTNTPEGYQAKWWIFRDDESCVIEYSIYSPDKELLTHWVGPCDLFIMLFHSSQIRKGT